MKKRKLPVSPEEIKELTNAALLSCMVVLEIARCAERCGASKGDHRQSESIHGQARRQPMEVCQSAAGAMVARTDRYIRR